MPLVTLPALGQYGLVVDQAAQEIPPNALSRVSNVRFRNGSATRFGGHVGIFDTPSVTPYYVAPFGTADKRYWIHSGLASTFADDGTTRTDISGTALTGTADDRFTGGALHGLFILSNAVDPPKYWNGDTGTNLATLTSWDANWRVKFIRPFKNFLVYGYPTKSSVAYPHTIGWSAAADPGTLPSTYDTSSTTTEAGDAPIGETPDKIVDGLTRGEVFLVYKEQSIYRMELNGDPVSVFSIKRIPGTFGMLARGCAADTPKGHVVLANGDVVLVDGFGEPQSLMDGRVRDWFFQTQLDSTNYARSWVAANLAKSEVWVGYPSIGASYPDKALVWSWIDNAWGIRDLPNATYAAAGLLEYDAADTWAADPDDWIDDSTLWGQNDFTPSDARFIMASTAPAIYLADSGTTYAGTTINASIERTGLVFDNPDVVKTWVSMTPRIRAAAGTVVYIQFGGSMSAEVAPTWSDPIEYTVGTSVKAFGFASGRYLAYRIYSTGKQGWSVKSIDCDIKPRGRN